MSTAVPGCSPGVSAGTEHPLRMGVLGGRGSLGTGAAVCSHATQHGSCGVMVCCSVNSVRKRPLSQHEAKSGHKGQYVPENKIKKKKDNFNCGSVFRSWVISEV